MENRYAWKIIFIFMLIFAAGGFHTGSGFATTLFTEEESAFISGNRDKVYTVAIEGSENVTTFLNEENKGLVYQVVDMIEAQTGLNFRIVSQPTVAEFVNSIETQSYDVYIGPNYTEERDEHLHFTPVLFNESYYFYANSAYDYIPDLYHIEGMHIGVLAGDYIVNRLTADYQVPEESIVFFKNRIELQEALNEGLIEMAVSAIELGYYTDDIVLISRLNTYNTALARVSVNRNKPMLAEIIDKVITNVLNTKDLEEIRKQTQINYVKNLYVQSLSEEEQMYINTCDAIYFTGHYDPKIIGSVIDALSTTIGIPIVKEALESDENNFLVLGVDTDDSEVKSTLRRAGPIMDVEAHVIGTNTSNLISSVHSLEGKTIGIDAQSVLLDSLGAYKNIVSVKKYRDLKMMFEDLSSGKIDYVIDTEIKCIVFLRDYKKYNPMLVSEGVYKAPVYLYVPKENINLINCVDKLKFTNENYNAEYIRVKDKLLQTIQTEEINSVKRKTIMLMLLIIVFVLMLFLYGYFHGQQIKRERDLLYKQSHDEETGLYTKNWFLSNFEELFYFNQRLAIVSIDLKEVHLAYSSDNYRLHSTFISRIAAYIKQLPQYDREIVAARGSQKTLLLSFAQFCERDQVINFIEDLMGKIEAWSENRDFAKEGVHAGLVFVEDIMHMDSVEGVVQTAISTAEYAGSALQTNMIVYTAELQEILDETSYINASILENNWRSKIKVAYQPIVSRNKSTIKGFEALVRWIEEDGRIFGPDKFVAAFEAMYRIEDMTKQVIELTLNKLNHFVQEYGEDIYISVNLSPKDKFEKSTIDWLVQELKSRGHNPKNIRIEITESAIIENRQMLIEFVDYAKYNGIHIALDDFGTGYSSLSYLGEMNFSIVKIDRSFVIKMLHDKKAEAVIYAIFELSRKLGFSVIAEGVEELEQVEYLAVNFDVDFQGYYFGKPELKYEDELG